MSESPENPAAIQFSCVEYAAAELYCNHQGYVYTLCVRILMVYTLTWLVVEKEKWYQGNACMDSLHQDRSFTLQYPKKAKVGHHAIPDVHCKGINALAIAGMA